MKKVIGILSVLLLAVALYVSSTSTSGTANMDLASLIAVNTANAEQIDGCDDDVFDRCTVGGTTYYDCDDSSFWHTCYK